MRFLACLLSLSLVVATPGVAAAVQIGKASVSGKIPTLTGPYKSQIHDGPLKFDTLKISGSLENSLHVIDPVLQQKVPAITPIVIDAAQPLDDKQPLELGISRSSLLFDNAKPFTGVTSVYAANTGFRSFGLAKNNSLTGPAKAGPASWADQARELSRLKAEAKSSVKTKVHLAIGAIMTTSTLKLLSLTLGYWGLGITGAAVLFIAGKFLQVMAREKKGRQRAWVLAQALKGGAPSSLQVVALVDDIKPALEKILAAASPENAAKAAEIRQFLAELETGERKNWSLTSAATNLKGTAEPLIDAYRHAVWDDKTLGLDGFAAREAELAALNERLAEASETGDRTAQDLRFLASRIARGTDDWDRIRLTWTVASLNREAAKAGTNLPYIDALLSVDTKLTDYNQQPTAENAELLQKALDAAVHARRWP